MKRFKTIDIGTPFWWVFDKKEGLLIYEDEKGFHRIGARIVPSKIKGSWTAELETGQNLLLWEEDEFTPETAVKITDYIFRGSKLQEANGWTNGLYLTLWLGLPWEKDEGLPTVRISGKNPAGETILDTLRLVIPQTGQDRPSFIAISERGTRYILSGIPKDGEERVGVFTPYIN